jgi:site-specific DNA recombinase
MYPAILDVTKWEALCAFLTDPARSGQHVHPGGRKYLLSGIIRCASCTTTLQGNADRQYGLLFFYSCHNPQCRQRVAVTGPKVDEIVTKLVLAYLADRVIERSDEQWAGEEDLTAATSRIIELMEQYGEGSLSKDVVFPTVQKLEDRVARLRAEKADWLRGQVTVRPSTNAVEAWPTMQVDQQRAVIGSVLHAVVVKPGKRGGKFDPDRIEPIFR